jgi:uncharacterized membrane protein YkoI
MTRKTLIMLAGGAIALAVTGSALGAGVAGVAADRDTTPRATVSTLGDDSSRRPVDDSAARPSDDGTARLSDDPTAAASTDRDRAIRIALEHTGGGTVVKVESEREHGRQQWSVRIVKGGVQRRMDVDAVTGQVVRSEQQAATDSHNRSGDDKGGHGRDDKGTDN